MQQLINELLKSSNELIQKTSTNNKIPRCVVVELHLAEMLENGAFLLDIEVLFEVGNDSDNLVEQLRVLHRHEALVADGLHYLNAGEGGQNLGVLSDVIEDLEGDRV